MKFAICLSGLTRTYQKTFDKFWSNIIEPLRKYGEVDVFISTWSIQDSHESIVNINEILNLYKPKSLEVENYSDLEKTFLLSNYTKKDCPIPQIVKNGVLLSIPGQYKILKCNLLKQSFEKINKFKYDFVIRTRFDLTIEELKVEDFIENKLNILYSFDNLIGDYFYISNSQIMDEVCGLFYNYENILNIEGTDMGPERNLFFHTKNKMIDFNILENYKYSLVREMINQDFKSGKNFICY